MSSSSDALVCCLHKHVDALGVPPVPSGSQHEPHTRFNARVHDLVLHADDALCAHRRDGGRLGEAEHAGREMLQVLGLRCAW